MAPTVRNRNSQSAPPSTPASGAPRKKRAPSVRHTETRMTGKKESPPSLGTGTVCTLRPSGTSKRRFL